MSVTYCWQSPNMDKSHNWQLVAPGLYCCSFCMAQMPATFTTDHTETRS